MVIEIPQFKYIIYDMSQVQSFTIVIQAGGNSSRMGRDKALMPFLGQPLIARLVNRLNAGFSENQTGYEIVVITNRPEDYLFLGVPLHGDLLPGTGPLGGLLTALLVTRSPVIGVAACDMPFLHPGLFLAQRSILIDEEADVVIPRSQEGLEPMHAVYRRSTCLPAVRAALDAGERKMVSWFSSVKVREMTMEEVERIDPGGLSFANVNSPEEFRWAEQEAVRREDPGGGFYPDKYSGWA